MNNELKEIHAIITNQIKKDYPEEVLRKIELDLDDSSLDISTSFDEPHLDVHIHLESGEEFVATYSNDNYSEHFYKKGIKARAVASSILELLDDLLRSGATQIDAMSRDGSRLLSSTTKVGRSENTTDVKKVAFFTRKKKLTKRYPPVL